MPQTKDLGNAENASGVNQSSKTPASGVSSAQILADSGGAKLPVTPGQGATPGLVGQSRFDDLLKQAPEKGTDAFHQWVASLPEDPSDPQYTQLIRGYKQDIGQAQQLLRTTPTPVKPINPVGTPTNPGLRDRSQADDVVQKRLDQQVKDAQSMSALQTGKRTKQDELAYRQAQDQTKPIVVGLPIDANQILSDASAAIGATVGIPSDWLKDFTKNWDLNLQGDYSAAAVKSGDYVYVGQVNDDAGGKNYKRDKYVYTDDAKAMLAGMDPNKIKAYQTKLGLAVTGIPDASLQALWDGSVKQAGLYARAGKKVDLNFIFDTLVGAAAAGSTGGGGNGLEKGAVDQAGVDYYRAMMQVLGDISGVNNGA